MPTRPAWLEKDAHDPILFLRTGATDASRIKKALGVLQGASAVV